MLGLGNLSALWNTGVFTFQGFDCTQTHVNIFGTKWSIRNIVDGLSIRRGSTVHPKYPCPPPKVSSIELNCLFCERARRLLLSPSAGFGLVAIPSTEKLGLQWWHVCAGLCWHQLPHQNQPGQMDCRPHQLPYWSHCKRRGLPSSSTPGSLPPHLFISSSSTTCLVSARNCSAALWDEYRGHWKKWDYLQGFCSLVPRPRPAFCRFQFSFAHGESLGTRLGLLLEIYFHSEMLSGKPG